MSVIFISGTGTDVGKTVATAALVAHLHSAGREVLPVKPVQTGEPEGSGDIFTIEELTGVRGVEFHRYPEPLAPNLAARRAGLPQPRRGELGDRIRELDRPGRTVLVEGAGGLLVRIADDFTLADLIVDLGAPLILVTGTGLGSLNDAALSVEVARHRGIGLLGLIGGRHPADPGLAARLNLSELEQVTGIPLLGVLREGIAQLPRPEFSGEASRLRLPGELVPTG